MYYYLHTNGSLIFKRFTPEDDSPFVKKVWRIDPADRETAYIVLLEALALGANKQRIKELAAKWGCTAEDLKIAKDRVSFTPLMQAGLKVFEREIISSSGAKTSESEQPLQDQ